MCLCNVKTSNTQNLIINLFIWTWCGHMNPKDLIIVVLQLDSWRELLWCNTLDIMLIIVDLPYDVPWSSISLGDSGVKQVVIFLYCRGICNSVTGQTLFFSVQIASLGNRQTLLYDEGGFSLSLPLPHLRKLGEGAANLPLRCGLSLTEMLLQDWGSFGLDLKVETASHAAVKVSGVAAQRSASFH